MRILPASFRCQLQVAVRLDHLNNKERLQMHTVGLFVLQRDEKDFFLFDIDGDLHPHRQAIEEQAGFFGLDPEQDVVLIGSLVGCRVLPENPGIILLFIQAGERTRDGLGQLLLRRCTKHDPQHLAQYLQHLVYHQLDG